MERFRVVLACCIAIGLSWLSPSAAAKSPSVAQILNTPALWGKDLPKVLTYARSWDAAGEASVAIFPDRVVGTTPYRTRQAAQPVAAKLANALKVPPPRPAPEFQGLLKDTRAQPVKFQAEVVPFIDDDLFRVALTGKGLQFLAPSLTVQRVQELLGPPDKTTTQFIQNETERRPITLTLHTYAGGAVTFVESSMAPKPGVVDRVVVELRAVDAAVFKEGQ